MADIKIDDIITRACGDRYEVLSVDDLSIKVLCIRSPDGNNQHVEVGDVEHNLKRRYKLIKDI